LYLRSRLISVDTNSNGIQDGLPWLFQCPACGVPAGVIRHD
jgi:hypothetical protein